VSGDTLTKRMAEELTDYLAEHGVKVRYLHSEVETVEPWRSSATCAWGVRRAGGHQPAARGLDLPEVSLVAVLDADKEGFLRSEPFPHPDDGTGGAHINGMPSSTRQGNRLDQACHRRDRPPRRKQVTYNERTASRPRRNQADQGPDRRVYDASETKVAQEEARYEAMSEKQIAREIRALEKRCSSTRRTRVRGGGEGARPARELRSACSGGARLE